MDDALVYEYLVRAAFQCGRFGVPFADASVYRGANTDEKQEKLEMYILISLKVLLQYSRGAYSQEYIHAFDDCFKELMADNISPDEAIARLRNYPL